MYSRVWVVLVCLLTAFSCRLSADTPRALRWAQVLGDGLETQLVASAAHPSGGTIVVGLTSMSEGAVGIVHDSSFNGVEDVWVAHVSDGGSVIWATYIGGNNADRPSSLSVGRRGIDIAGTTFSTDFGQNPAPFPDGVSPENHAFLVRLTLDGRNITSSWVSRADSANKVVQLRGGDSVVTGYTTRDLPVSTGSVDTKREGYEGWIARLRDGEIVWQSYLGGSGGDYISGLVLSKNESVVVVGSTDSPDFPFTNSVGSRHRNSRTFASRIKSDGSAVEASTEIGDVSSYLDRSVSPLEGGQYVAEGPTGEIVVTGQSYQLLPFNTDPASLIVLLDSQLSRIRKAVYVPGLQYAEPQRIGRCLAVFGAGTGEFLSSDGTAVQEWPGGPGCDQCRDAAVALFRRDLNRSLYSTLLGGGYGWERIQGVSGEKGSLTVVGTTNSVDFPGNVFDSGRMYQGFIVNLAKVPALNSCFADED